MCCAVLFGVGERGLGGGAGMPLCPCLHSSSFPPLLIPPQATAAA